MSKPSYSVDQIEKIVETDDIEAVRRVTDIVTDEFDSYSLFDKGRLDQLLKTKINKLLTIITRKENDNNV